MDRGSDAGISPFALPSDTGLRFVLLVSAVLAAALLLDHSAYSALHGREYARAVRECAAAPSLSACLAPEDRLTAIVMLLGVAWLVVVAAVVSFWGLPRWWVRGKGVKAYASTDPGAAATIAAYCERLHISQLPRLFVRSSRVPSAVAFHYGGRAALILNLGLLLQSRLDPTAFRAVVLHELAHVRNGDVGRTFLALSAVIALFATSVVPYAIAVLLTVFGPNTHDRDPLYILGIVWRVGVLILTVVVALAGVLRARELFADARASAWDGPQPALRRAVDRLQPSPTRAPGWLALHPSPAERSATLDDARRLLRATRMDFFVVGVIAGAVTPELGVLLGLLLAGIAADWYAVLAGAIAGALLTAIVGLVLCRAALGEVLGGDAHRAPGLGLALGAGLVVGQTVSLTGALDTSGFVALHPAELGFAVVDAGLLLMSASVLVGWMQSSVRDWVQVAVRRQSARLPLAVCLGTWGFVVAVWYGSLVMARDFGSTLLLAEINGTGSVRLAMWLLATVPLFVALVASAVAVLVARGCLSLGARKMVRFSTSFGEWLQPREPVLFSHTAS